MDTTTNMINEDVKKKRGRKKKEPEEEALAVAVPESQVTADKLPKKRGRKPKGGKLIATPVTDNH